MDDSVRRLLTEHLPPLPPGMAEPPLAAIRRRARRRSGTQVAVAVAAAALIAGGSVVVLADGDAAPVAGPPATTDPTTTASALPDMLYPTHLPAGYQADPGGATSAGSEVVLRYINPAADPQIPLVIRRMPDAAAVAAEGPLLQSASVRGHPAEIFPIANGGMALTWLETGYRYSVSFEAPPNTMIDFAFKETVDVLAAVAEGLRPGR
jgi:hypothetical protein